LNVLQKDVTVILMGCGFGAEIFENYERLLCAVGIFRRYICTEAVSAEAEETNV